MTESTCWVVPDGWLPPAGDGDVEGHEAVCILNRTDDDASLELSFYFTDREPEVVQGLVCGARRTLHARLDRPEEVGGYQLPTETPYALEVRSDVRVTVQHTRVDTRSPALTLMTVAALPVGPDAA